MTKKKKLIIIGIIVALLFAAGGYWYYLEHRYLDLGVNSSVDQGYVPAGAIVSPD